MPNSIPAPKKYQGRRSDGERRLANGLGNDGNQIQRFLKQEVIGLAEAEGRGDKVCGLQPPWSIGKRTFPGTVLSLHFPSQSQGFPHSVCCGGDPLWLPHYRPQHAWVQLSTLGLAPALLPWHELTWSRQGLSAFLDAFKSCHLPQADRVCWSFHAYSQMSLLSVSLYSQDGWKLSSFPHLEVHSITDSAVPLRG